MARAETCVAMRQSRCTRPWVVVLRGYEAGRQTCVCLHLLCRFSWSLFRPVPILAVPLLNNPTIFWTMPPSIFVVHRLAAWLCCWFKEILGWWCPPADSLNITQSPTHFLSDRNCFLRLEQEGSNRNLGNISSPISWWILERLLTRCSGPLARPSTKFHIDTYIYALPRTRAAVLPPLAVDPISIL